MTIKKGDKFQFHLSKWNNKKKTIEIVYRCSNVFDDYFECQKQARKQAIELQLYYGITKCNKEE